MPVVAVVNRKGGSGKSTFAAHLAAWCARQGYAVMLGDVDRQQSTRSWLRKRSEDLPAIAPWTVDQNILRVPKGITHVVLDTPGGLHGFDLARMVMFADIIIMPVCGSAFDRESAADCHAELMALPRVASGRCKLACIGMRIDVRTRTPEILRDWAQQLGLPFLGVLRETQSYVQCLERGMTLFDLPADRVATDLAQWTSILSWLQPQLAVTGAAAPAPQTSIAPPPNRLLNTPQAPTGAASLLGAGATVRPQAARPMPPATPAPATSATSASRPASPAHQLLASRPAPAVTRLNNPRVLDRVGARPSTGETAAADAPLPIPAFLKLVKG